MIVLLKSTNLSIKRNIETLEIQNYGYDNCSSKIACEDCKFYTNNIYQECYNIAIKNRLIFNKNILLTIKDMSLNISSDIQNNFI